MSGLGGNAFVLVGATITVGLDQLAKLVVVSCLDEGQLHPLRGNSGLVRRTSAGAAFVSLSLRSAILVWFSAVTGLMLLVVLGAPLSGTRAIGIGLVVGGATGNLADRLARGGVVDFIAVGRWPTFNLADAAMVSGLGLAAWSLP